MCLIALHFRPCRNTPILLAANREEFFRRPTLSPHLQNGFPRVICGIDQRAGGTWLGVNQFGLLVAVTNRRKTSVGEDVRSRGLLCRDLLNFASVEQALDHARAELQTGRYAGANFLAVSDNAGAVLHAGDELQMVPLEPGLHLIANSDLNDPDDVRLRRARVELDVETDEIEEFLVNAARVCALSDGSAPIVLRGDVRGTVSSSLIAVSRDCAKSRFLYADGSPDRTAYVDCSPALRTVLDVTPASN